MTTRAVIRNRQKEGEYVCTSRNIGFKKSAALNQWYWGPRITATTFDSPSAARVFAATRVKTGVTIVLIEQP